MKRMTIAFWSGGIFLVGGIVGAQNQSVLDTPHNLSTAGPGTIRAQTEEEVCIFCHTPHNSSAIAPLWNRDMPIDAYTIYRSSSLDANPGQPTGWSKLCLSCHDGTIALGSVLSRDQDILMVSGITVLPAGDSNLGTDLSDDHPISFRYDVNLVGKDSQLVDPSLLPPEIKLDSNLELQCTTCHEAHDNTFGSFLVSDNSDSGLCKSCHQITTTTIVEHQACVSCHQTHSAPSGPFLLQADRVTTTCVTCHDGSHGQAPNILIELQKLDVHDTNREADPPNPIPNEVTCTNCHDPHTMTPGVGRAPTIHPNFGDIDGINAAGSYVAKASFEYETCFKCHGDNNAMSQSWVGREITQINTRLEFELGSVSFHPVEGPGRNSNVLSLKPGWTESSVVYCSDCHGSETSRKAGGTGADGVHGSNEEPLLLARYETADFTQESTAAYALCYRCHYRDGADGLLNDRSFEHRKHLEEDTPCSACHDPHGITSSQGHSINNAHLINFDRSIVSPDPTTGLLKYESLGEFQGQCFLECHGEKHSPKKYPD